MTVSTKPFPCLVWDDFYPAFAAEELYVTELQRFQNRVEGIYVSYDSPFETNKFTTRDLGKRSFDHFQFMHSADIMAVLEERFKISGLEGDGSLHGGGVHVTTRGGKLDIHLDYNIHPVTGKQRRLSAILYLNPVWRPDWGGALELWNWDMTACRARVMPKFNRLVVFENTEFAFHGHPDPLNCPEDTPRISLANFYLTDPVPGAVPRKRAQFFARPGDPTSPEIEAARLARTQ